MLSVSILTLPPHLTLRGTVPVLEAAENLANRPALKRMAWSVSQAAPLRRVKARGGLSSLQGFVGSRFKIAEFQISGLGGWSGACNAGARKHLKSSKLYVYIGVCDNEDPKI